MDRNRNRPGQGLLGLSFPRSAQPRPHPLRPADIVGCPFAGGRQQEHLSTTSLVRFLCAGLWVSFSSREEGEGCGEVVGLLSMGAIGCLFRDHPEDCWPGASQAPGNSVSVPGVS